MEVIEVIEIIEDIIIIITNKKKSKYLGIIHMFYRFK